MRGLLARTASMLNGSIGGRRFDAGEDFSGGSLISMTFDSASEGFMYLDRYQRFSRNVLVQRPLGTPFGLDVVRIDGAQIRIGPPVLNAKTWVHCNGDFCPQQRSIRGEAVSMSGRVEMSSRDVQLRCPYR